MLSGPFCDVAAASATRISLKPCGQAEKGRARLHYSLLPRSSYHIHAYPPSTPLSYTPLVYKILYAVDQFSLGPTHIKGGPPHAILPSLEPFPQSQVTHTGVID
ncbi:hypothetical protein BDN71DRAFT_1280081 [Pleurotus eryngii]|uniref:Uncharacterized protein n=1 Tax=Pleurotus eryngii TaxID=5323 RepID=A0A9P5ZPC2_PLEER|nr:hypothetical protein BDN71DRAFT_1280081 [Pleurotus eryngii]